MTATDDRTPRLHWTMSQRCVKLNNITAPEKLALPSQPWTPSSRNRIRQVRARYARIRLTEFIIVFGSIILGFAIFITAANLFLSPGSATAKSPRILFATISTGIVMMLVLILAGIYWARARSRRNAQRKVATRYERLSRIVDHPDARTRLPHRVAEHALCGMVNPIRIMKKIAKWLPPGNVIVCLTAKASRISQVVPVDVPFEPVDAARDKEQLNWLSYLCDSDIRDRVDAGEVDPSKPFEHIDRKDLNVAPDSLPLWKRLRKWISRRSAWISAFAYLLLFVSMSLEFIIKFIQNPTLSGSRIELTLLIVGVFVLFVVVQLAWARLRSVFLIPGGIAHRRLTLAGGTTTIRRFSSDNASIVALLMNDNTPAVAFITVASPGQKPLIFATHLHAVIGAWYATSPAPTDDQLAHLLDPST